jgi:hypothetical protein
MLILSKDTRQAKAKIELDLGSIPAPISQIECASDGLCFPAFGGVWVNPTSRLALKGSCQSVCDGILTYFWTIYEEPEATSNLTYVRFFNTYGDDVVIKKFGHFSSEKILFSSNQCYNIFSSYVKCFNFSQNRKYCDNILLFIQ